MKIFNSDTLFQLILLGAILIVWNIWAIRQTSVEQALTQGIAEQPYICSADSLTTLERASERLLNLGYIDKVEIETADSMKARMFRDIEGEARAYLSDEARAALHDTHIPNILYIFLKGKRFGVDEFSGLKETLAAVSRTDTIRVYEEWNEENVGRLDVFRSSNFVYHFIIALCWTILAVVMRIFFEKRDQRYWVVIARSGGDIRRRGRFYWIRTAILSGTLLLLSLILVLAYAAAKHVRTPMVWSLPLIQTGLIFAGSVAAFIITGREIRP